MLFRAILFSLGLSVTGGCVPPTPLMAEPPEVEPLARRAVGGSFELELLDVSDQRTCGHNPKFNDLCVSQLRSALDAGVRSVLRQFIDPRRPGEKYAASFELLEFAQGAVFIGEGDFEHPNIVMRWRFELKNGAGERLLLLTESTDEAFRDGRQAHDALQEVLEEAMERIGGGLSNAEWRTSRARPMQRPPIDRRRRPESVPASPPSVAPTEAPENQDAGTQSAPAPADADAAVLKESGDSPPRLP